MRLRELAAGFDVSPTGADPEIEGMTEDSRHVRPGVLFVAVPGTALDGHAYIADAVARGAPAVVAERTGLVPAGVPAVRAPSSRAALAVLAARFHGMPADDLKVIGFTGTFGKTSTSEILRTLLEAGGTRTGVVGSLGSRFGEYEDPGNGLTTPAPIELHRSLRALKRAGAASVVLEVTSHALRLGRVHGLEFSGGLIAAILPGEHTDFHRSYEDYIEAKQLFLDHLASGAVLAYDADNRAARRLAGRARDVRPVGFSVTGRDTGVRLHDVRLDGSGASFTIGGPAGASGFHVRSALLGRGHLRNVALALTYAIATGLPPEVARGVLESLQPLRRRMERYQIAGRVVLDDTAAHPDSFRATFEVVSMVPHRSLVVVYAIRGNRGEDVNRQNAFALADLVSVHGADALIVTASAECTGSTDRATPQEIDATRQMLVVRGRQFVWHDALAESLHDALERTQPGDLIVLLGAQGMNRGREILEELGSNDD